MSDPTIHGFRRTLSASSILASVGQALGEIRQQDGLTWNDIGHVLGKSEDQAAKYADGSAEMGLVAFYRGKAQWNGRFTGYADRLVTETRPRALDDNAIHSKVIRAALAIAEAKENGGDIFDWEVRIARPVLEQAKEAIEELLSMAPAQGVDP